MPGCPLSLLAAAPLADDAEVVVLFVDALADVGVDDGAAALAADSAAVEVVNVIARVGTELLDAVISSYKSQGNMRWPAWLSSRWYCADPGLS